jgi:gentisate 1,2-dioxygenase
MQGRALTPAPQADDKTFLFRFDDRPMIKALNFYRIGEDFLNDP